MGVIGRWAECGRLDTLLRDERLVAVTGPGGIGKSALVAEVVRRQASSVRRDIRWADFSALSDPALVPRWLAYSLRTSRPSRRRRVLLVVETCERAAEASAKALGTLVREQPDLHVVATSRLPLDAPAEVRLESLPIEDAVRLFEMCAPDPRGQDRETVREICELLDGLPLAIRIAARQLAHRSPEDLLAQLSRPENGLDLLDEEAGRPERQRSLRDSLAWSQRFCTVSERLLWARSSVFPGAFTAEAATEVCADERLSEGAVAEALSGLEAQQLIVTEPESGRGLFRMRREARAFGRQQLLRLGEDREFQRRCIRWSIEAS